MKLLRRYRVKVLQFLNLFIYFDNYSISYYFSRFGNNLQQIAIGILYSQKLNANFYVKNHIRVQNFSVINKPLLSYFSLFKQHYRFFYFQGQKDLPTQILSEDYIIKHIEKTFKSYILPNIDFIKDINVPHDTLVIHIRSGDIFDIPISSYYQNPINYYENLIKNYKNVILVTSEEQNNPVIKVLLKNNKVKLQTSSLENDFNLLANARNLATSGVGTFPIAAALLSTKLKNFYYTNLFSEEHLNPKMLFNNQVIHHLYTVEDNYKDKYLVAKDLKSLILDENINIYKN